MATILNLGVTKLEQVKHGKTFLYTEVHRGATGGFLDICAWRIPITA